MLAAMIATAGSGPDLVRDLAFFAAGFAAGTVVRARSRS
jgi:hypothetical protein